MEQFKVVTIFLFICINYAACYWTGNIVFQDEFNGTSLYLNKWQYETGCSGYGSGNLEYYVEGTNNVQVRDGKLIITAKVEQLNGKNYTSGRISQKGQGFAYGAYVTRAKLPKGKHLWPAFWLLKEVDCKYEEIDIMEYRGQEVSRVAFSAHYGRRYDAVVSKGENYNAPADLSTDLHEYAVLWLPDRLEFYVDYVKYQVLSLDPEIWRQGYNNPCGDEIKPFTELNNFVINLAVGGSFFSHHGELTMEEARQWPQPSYEIDWVRVYQE